MDDILLNSDMDVYAVNGDFVVGDSTEQDIYINLQTAKGSFKQSPLIGANVRQYLDGVINNEAKRNIRLALQADDIKIKSIEYKHGELKINAKD